MPRRANLNRQHRHLAQLDGDVMLSDKVAPSYMQLFKVK